jgi:hypothetical protein
LVGPKTNKQTGKKIKDKIEKKKDEIDKKKTS